MLPTTSSNERGAIKGALLLVLVIVGGVLLAGGCQYNSLVGSQESVRSSWSEVDNQYRRRADLVPNLVETVKGAADFERSTLEAVVEARASIGKTQLPGDLPTDPEQLQAYIAAQQQLSGALSRLLVVAEQYPQLEATQNFLSLQDQLEGTENRIAVARRDYIEASRTYNTRIRTFPTNVFASVLGFQPVAQFEVDPAQREAPKIDFGGRGK